MMNPSNKRTKHLPSYKSKALGFGAVAVLSGLTFNSLLTEKAQAAIVITGAETGGNVVFSYTGTLDTTGLGTPTNSGGGFANAISPSGSVLVAGQNTSTNRLYENLNISGPSSFGTGGLDISGTGAGDIFGLALTLATNPPAIQLPQDDAAEVLELDYKCFGSSTWKQKSKEAGVEPDNCFYFQNEALIRGQLNFDLTQDPPPDLALEIDLTSKSLNCFPIYARLGIPEIWCYDSGELKIYQLEGEDYIETEQSLVFPNLKIADIPTLIESYRTAGRRTFRQAVREWVRKQSN